MILITTEKLKYNQVVFEWEEDLGHCSRGDIKNMELIFIINIWICLQKHL